VYSNLLLKLGSVVVTTSVVSSIAIYEISNYLNYESSNNPLSTYLSHIPKVGIVLGSMMVEKGLEYKLNSKDNNLKSKIE